MGSGWYDFWTGNKFKGGQRIETSATIDKFPLFVKEGSIVPLGPTMQYADEKLPEEITLLVFPGKNCSFTLYEDDGKTYDYEKGLYSTIRFDWDDSARILTISKQTGSYPGMLIKRKFLVSVIQQNSGEAINIDKGRIVDYKSESISIGL